MASVAELPKAKPISIARLYTGAVAGRKPISRGPNPIARAVAIDAMTRRSFTVTCGNQRTSGNRRRTTAPVANDRQWNPARATSVRRTGFALTEDDFIFF